jgi:hypothetical protein
VLSPAFRLAFGATLGQSTPAPDGAASFAWRGARAEACPIRAALGARLEALPCAAFELGTFSGSATGVPAARNATVLWTAAVAGARVGWAIVRSTLFVEAAAEVAVPFQRDRFYVGPDSTVYQVPAVGGGASLGIRYSFL